MIVKNLNDSHTVCGDNWQSVRMLLSQDNMGFSFHITTIYAGTETPIHYQNHLESVYCIEGEGEVELVDTGEVFKITPGTVYALDKHDKHLLRSTQEMTLACVFNPPLQGTEVHDKDGVYPLIEGKE